MQKITNITQKRILEERANEILEEFKRWSGKDVMLPIPVESIATDFLKIPFRACNIVELQNGLDGLLLVHENTILLNEVNGWRHNRFVIAHELGHKIVPDDRQVLKGVGKPHKQKDEAMLRQNINDGFASALLMPIPLLISETRKYRIIDAQALEKLAEIFRVPSFRMLKRIQYLIRYGQFLMDAPILTAKLAPGLESAVGRGHEKQINSNAENSNKNLTTKPVAKGFVLPRIKTNDKKYPEVIRITNERLLRLGVGYFTRQRNGKGEREPIKSPADRLGRPLVIEFSGTPNAGKNAQIAILEDYLIDIRKLRVKVIDEDYRNCPSKGCSQIEKFFWAAGTTIRNLMQILDQPPMDDVVIFNRGLFDKLAFLHWYLKRGDIDKNEEQTAIEFLSIKRFTSIIDVVFLVTVDPNVSMTRESIHPRQAVANLAKNFDPMIPANPSQRVVNLMALEVLNKSYEYTFDEHKNKFNFVYKLEDDGEHNTEEISFVLMDKLHSQLSGEEVSSQKNLFPPTLKITADEEIRKLWQLSFSDLF